MSRPAADCVIIGGGLAGLLCARELGRHGLQVSVLDRPLAPADGLHGGFSVFSGAKFSLPPAGMSLGPIVGGTPKLFELCLETLDYLGLRERLPESWDAQRAIVEDEPFNDHLRIRRYHSLVLLPDEMKALVVRLHSEVSRVANIMRREVREISWGTGKWCIVCKDEAGAIEELYSRNIVLAAGRTFPTGVLPPEFSPQPGKGVDVGVRIEFGDRRGTRALFAQGPDAKLLAGRARTFCLNHPGQIFWYGYNGLQIPGGVVAEPEHGESNVGILVRLSDRERTLSDLQRRQGGRRAARFPFANRAGLPLSEVANLLGAEATGELFEFIEKLLSAGLLDFSRGGIINAPLIDWHWSTYAVPGSLRAAAPNAWVIGDSSGHARGLLQSAVSGVYAARTMLE